MILDKTNNIYHRSRTTKNKLLGGYPEPIKTDLHDFLASKFYAVGLNRILQGLEFRAVAMVRSEQWEGKVVARCVRIESLDQGFPCTISACQDIAGAFLQLN